MDNVLEQLKKGVRHFQTEMYPQQAEFFQRAASERQQPHTLFIACSDSRVDPVAITSASPGDIFVNRNIGNMVPAFGEMLGGVSAVIEFAVSGLRVKHIVVCGHTKCGAMQALLEPDTVTTMPTVQHWLKNAQTATSVVADHKNISAKPVEVLTQQNVLLQLQHLKTHPSVAEAMEQGRLTISGWVYNIATGDVEIAEDGQQTFVPVR